jgi:hypothetical protein
MLLLACPQLMLLSLPRVEAKGFVATIGIVAHKGGISWDPPLIWVSMAFYIFPCTWKMLPSMLT